jgi:hypothetical protein
MVQPKSQGPSTIIVQRMWGGSNTFSTLAIRETEENKANPAPGIVQQVESSLQSKEQPKGPD